jgi:hypothetical protein
LYATPIETIDDIVEQFDKTSETNVKPNEKFSNSLALSIIGREHSIQWDKKSDKSTGLQSMTQLFLQKNQPLSFEKDGVKTSSVVKNTTTYSCFPVIFQNYVTENAAGKDGICIYSPGGEKYTFEQNEFDTAYSV